MYYTRIWSVLGTGTCWSFASTAIYGTFHCDFSLNCCIITCVHDTIIIVLLLPAVLLQTKPLTWSRVLDTYPIYGIWNNSHGVHLFHGIHHFDSLATHHYSRVWNVTRLELNHKSSLQLNRARFVSFIGVFLSTNFNLVQKNRFKCPTWYA